MALYDDIIIRNVVDSSDIVSIISEYTHLEKKGHSYVGCCPFHSEKTGSFYVDPDKKLYNCFGCHKGGNIVRFIMEMENVSFPRAIELLAEKANIQLPQKEMSREEEARLKERKKIYDINKASANYYYKALRSKYGTEGMSYLKDKRQLSDEILKSFAMGYSPKNGNFLIAELKQKGFKEDDMVKAGVVLQSSKGNYYDKFFGRIIFPILDVNDNVIGFSGRSLDGEGAKYMNTAEIGVFQKRYNLFALNKAKKSKRGYIILVEGNVDVVSLHEAGFDNAVASLGTALTPEQSRLLKKYTHDVILLYDSDNAGINAAFKAIPLLRDAGISVRVLNVIDAKDPDEFIKKYGSEEFEKLILTAKGYVEYELDVFSKKYNIKDSYAKKEFINSAFERINEIKDIVDKELYLEKLSDVVKIDVDTLKRKLNGEIKDAPVVNKEKVEEVEADKDVRTELSLRKERMQKQLFSILLNDDPILFKKLKRYLNVGEMETDFLNALLLDIYEEKEKTEKIDLANFLNHYEELAVQDQIMEIFKIMKQFDTDKRKEAGNKILRELVTIEFENIIAIKNDEYMSAQNEDEQKKIALELTQLTKNLQEIKSKDFWED